MSVNPWDYIVIGAGSAGCVVADQLSASGSKRVLLLEAGGNDDSMVIKVPMAVARFDTRRFDWGYQSAPDPTRNHKSEHWTRGRVVGGTGSINGMNYVRGSPLDYDRWESMGNRGWAARDVMPLFKAIERCDWSSIPPADGSRGRAGSLHVRMVKHPHRVTDSFIQAAQRAGHRYTPDYNGSAQEGIGYAQLNQRGRRRWSAADAFLRPALRRGNLRLITGAYVRKLLLESGQVCGVLYETHGRLQQCQARNVVLCAGAINTPHLLMLSGIGDAERLAEQGIRVVLDRKAVGQNLMEHPLVPIIYRVKTRTYNPTGGPFSMARLVAKYVMRGDGPLACAFESLAFLKTRPERDAADVQLHVAAFGYGAALEGAVPGARPGLQMLPYPSITVLVNKNYPLSRGQIRLASPDPKTPPLIEPRLLVSAEDVQTLVQGIAMVRDIVATPPMAHEVSEEIIPGHKYGSEDSLRSYVKDNTEIAYHPSGTCRMGVDEDAVVTPELQVRGVENLWIADASVMPDLISGNTNAACMMIGMKLGQMLNARNP